MRAAISWAQHLPLGFSSAHLQLVQVNVYGNDIDSVSKLTDHDIIVNYDPT